MRCNNDKKESRQCTWIINSFFSCPPKKAYQNAKGMNMTLITETLKSTIIDHFLSKSSVNMSEVFCDLHTVPSSCIVHAVNQELFYPPPEPSGSATSAHGDSKGSWQRVLEQRQYPRVKGHPCQTHCKWRFLLGRWLVDSGLVHAIHTQTHSHTRKHPWNILKLQGADRSLWFPRRDPWRKYCVLGHIWGAC